MRVQHMSVRQGCHCNQADFDLRQIRHIAVCVLLVYIRSCCWRRSLYTSRENLLQRKQLSRFWQGIQLSRFRQRVELSRFWLRIELSRFWQRVESSAQLSSRVNSNTNAYTALLLSDQVSCSTAVGMSSCL